MAFRIQSPVVAAGLSVVLAACAGGPPPPPPPEPTFAQVNISASENANPDVRGRASPARVYIYALKPGAQFATADPDALLGGELGALAETMSRIANFVQPAGKSTKKRFDLPDSTTGLGIAVAYRQFDTAKWRASAPITPNEVTLLKATIGANEVTLGK